MSAVEHIRVTITLRPDGRDRMCVDLKVDAWVVYENFSQTNSRVVSSRQHNGLTPDMARALASAYAVRFIDMNVHIDDLT